MLSDDLAARPTNSMKEIAERFAQQVHATYSTAFTSELARCQQLASLKPFVAGANDSADRRTEAEEKEYNNLTVGLSLGFCIGGYLLPERKPQAFSIHFNPVKSGLPEVVSVGATSFFWGAPKIFVRLIKGFEPEMINDIVSSGKWTGTSTELVNLLSKHELNHPILPIREAVDYVHACIYATIKAMKFSVMSQICGGPIELATITTDRKFRWVRHKEWDSAILDGEMR